MVKNSRENGMTSAIKFDVERLDPLAVGDNPCLELFLQNHTARYKEAARWIEIWRRDVQRKWSTLDAACGTGYGGEWLAAQGCYIGLDISDPALNTCRERYPRLEFHQADLMEKGVMNPLKPDCIVSFETLEHLPDPDVFLSHCFEALNRNREKEEGSGAGHFICSAPIIKTRDFSRYHLHDRTLAEWRASILKAGFQIEMERVQSFECRFSDFVKSTPDEPGQARRVALYILLHPSYWFERFWWWVVKRKFRFAGCFFVCST